MAWNVIEGVVAMGAGIITGSVSLVAFGAYSFIEVISAVALLWRLRKAGPHASAEERGAAERRALYLVTATFFLLAAYISYEAVDALLSREGPENSTVGLVLSVVSLHSNFEMVQNRALFAGTVVVGGGGREDGNSVDIGGGSCIDGYVNATGTIAIAGEVRRSGSASEEDRPGFFDVILWSWRELYE